MNNYHKKIIWIKEELWFLINCLLSICGLLSQKLHLPKPTVWDIILVHWRKKLHIPSFSESGSQAERSVTGLWQTPDFPSMRKNPFSWNEIPPPRLRYRAFEDAHALKQGGTASDARPCAWWRFLFLVNNINIDNYLGRITHEGQKSCFQAL